VLLSELLHWPALDVFCEETGAQDRISPNFMGLTSLGLETGIFCDFLYSALLLNAILGLYVLGLALS
jgi:hypothetical protein